ncbi:MAG: DnaB-like helicase C-terminal domain-containing protein [Duodenibacillus sp.]
MAFLPENDNGVYDYEAAFQAVQGETALFWADRYEDSFLTLLEVGQTGFALPFDNRFRFRPGELTIWAGQNGAGKSLITSQIVVKLAQAKIATALFSFEMPPARSLERMMRQYCGSTPVLPDGSVDITKAQRFCRWLHKRVLILSENFEISPLRVLGATAVAATTFGCRHVFIDNLTCVMEDDDDYSAQKRFVRSLKQLASQLNIHIHLVCHARKGKRESDEIDKFSIKGSGAIADLADNQILIQRSYAKDKARAEGGDKFATLDNDNGDAVLRIAKQRNGDWEGFLQLWFDPASKSYCTTPSRDHKTWLEV